jgi:hypothetical protein
MEKRERKWETAIIILIFALILILVLAQIFRKPEKGQRLWMQATIAQGANFFSGEDYPVKDPTVVVEVDTGGVNGIMVRVVDPCAIKSLLYYRFFFVEDTLEIGRPGDIYLDSKGEWMYKGQLIGPAN